MYGSADDSRICSSSTSEVPGLGGGTQGQGSRDVKICAKMKALAKIG